MTGTQARKSNLGGELICTFGKIEGKDMSRIGKQRL